MQPTAASDAAIAAADALLRDGCYDCLVDALGKLEPLVNASEPARRGYVSAAGLLAIRGRQLGLDDPPYLDMARAADTDPTDAMLFDVIASLPRRVLGPTAAFDEAQLDAMRPGWRNRERWQAALLERIAATPLTAVTALTFHCTFGEGAESDLNALVAQTAGLAETPLVQFTAATCATIDAGRLRALHAANPRFVEIDYLLGQRTARDEPEQAEPLLSRAVAWRPRWPAALSMLGEIATTAEDFDKAADYYERALAVVPDNADLQLRRIRALSVGGHYEPALRLAEQLVANGRWFVGDGLYWKAWNEAQLDRMDAAWADVHEAAKLLSTAEVAKLTGVLAIRRSDLPAASTALQQAHDRNPSDCETGVLQGSVRLELGDWAAAATPLLAAVDCLDKSDADLRSEIAKLRQLPGRERSIARREAEIAAHQELRAQSWYGVAVAAFNRGDGPLARDYAQKVVDDRRFGARAKELLARIGR